VGLEAGPIVASNYLSLRLWDSYEDIVAACCAAWNAFIADT